MLANTLASRWFVYIHINVILQEVYHYRIAFRRKPDINEQK